MGALLDAVSMTLEALDLPAKDQAAAELAVQLADEIDGAHAAERLADRALSQLTEGDDDLDTLIRTLRAKAGHRDAIVRCGQRLESLLVQLGATPAARGRAGGNAPAIGGPLSLLRGGAAG